LEKVRRAIQSIGHTVMVAEPFCKPFALTRTFCVYEAFFTLSSGNAFEIIVPPGAFRSSAIHETEMCDDIWRSNVERLIEIPVNVESADCRKPRDKEALLDAMERAEGGIVAVNSTINDTMRILVLESIRREMRNHSRDDAFLDVVLTVLKNTVPHRRRHIAQRLLTCEGLHGRTIIHTAASKARSARSDGNHFTDLADFFQHQLLQGSSRSSDLHVDDHSINRFKDLADFLQDPQKAFKKNVHVSSPVDVYFFAHDDDKAWMANMF